MSVRWTLGGEQGIGPLDLRSEQGVGPVDLVSKFEKGREVLHFR